MKTFKSFLEESENWKWSEEDINSPEPSTRARVAQYTTDSNVHKFLSDDPSPRVRRVVAIYARNPEIHHKLANDEDKHVRENVASNTFVPELHHKFYKDNSMHDALLFNPYVSDDIKTKIKKLKQMNSISQQWEAEDLSHANDNNISSEHHQFFTNIGFKKYSDKVFNDFRGNSKTMSQYSTLGNKLAHIHGYLVNRGYTPYVRSPYKDEEQIPKHKLPFEFNKNHCRYRKGASIIDIDVTDKDGPHEETYINHSKPNIQQVKYK